MAFTPSRLYCCTGVGLLRLGSFRRRSAAWPRPQPSAATMNRREKYRTERGYAMNRCPSDSSSLPSFEWQSRNRVAKLLSGLSVNLEREPGARTKDQQLASE